MGSTSRAMGMDDEQVKPQRGFGIFVNQILFYQFQLGSNDKPSSAPLSCDTVTHFLIRHSLATRCFAHSEVMNYSTSKSKRANLCGAQQTFVI